MMTSNKPYFIRAIYDWIMDNNCTPYIVVDATLPFVEVPEQFVTEGRIILNISQNAVADLVLGNEWISFSARFSGIEEFISIPVGALIAIYAQENAQGMGFEVEALPEDYFEEMAIIKESRTTPKKGPSLNIVSGQGAPSTEGKKSEYKRPNLTVID